MHLQPRVNVFISSTERDLFSYRNAAIGGVIQAGMFPLLRETFNGTGSDPLTLSKDMIDQCEVFIGIYALKYGGSPAGLQISWTEAEYDYALSKKKAFLIFFLHHSQHSSWDPELTDTGLLAQKLGDFKDKLARSHMYNFFSNEDELYSKVSEFLSRKPYSDIGKDRMVYEPIFKLPKPHSQYNADVFMVMPFRENLYPVYDDHIKKTVEKLGLTIKRGDDFFNTNSIVDDIWAAINNAQLVIADCTGKNPNVFYELGIAHTIGKKTVVIAQSESDIPFDIRQYRYVVYEYIPRGMTKFDGDLEGAIKKILNIP